MIHTLLERSSRICTMFKTKVVFTLALLITLGSSTAWGQSEGLYYIDNATNHSGATSGRYYLIPADDPQKTDKNDAFYSSDYSAQNGDSEKPFLTTYKTDKDAATVPTGVVNNLPNNSVWIWKAVTGESGYFYIIHASSGKYVVYEPPYSAKNNRKSMHLFATDSPDENAKFEITTQGTGYNIRPKSVTSGNRFFNPSGSNQDYYHGNGGTDGVAVNYIGTIGIYSGASGNSVWYTESTLLAAPTISDVDESTNTFTITDANSLPTGYTIRYTTDGTAPTATTGTVYSDPVLVADDWTVKAVVVRYGIVLTEVATKAVSPLVAKPVISFDNSTNKVSISSATAGAAIYYNTGDGSQADPTTTGSTPYSTPFDVTSPITVKAISSLAGIGESSVATLVIAQVATPTIQNNGSNAISITCATAGATIYYTTDGSTPTTSSTQYTGPLTENISSITIKAIAVKENMITSAVGSGSVTLQCATPVITRNGMSFSIACSLPSDATIYYSLDGTTPTTVYSGAVTFTVGQLPMTVSAVAKHADYTDSGVATFILKNGDGTVADPYLIYSASDFANFVNDVNNGTTSSACYKLEVDVSAKDIGTITTDFSGIFDGNFHTISKLGHALFNTVSGGTVKNVILDEVSISSGTNVGAIANEVTGTATQKACVFNCGVLSGSIGGSVYVGGIVGQLGSSSDNDDCFACVINCFSYADITGGSDVGGIVGYNCFASKSNDIRTMVMNCMFYGDITGTVSSKAPVYNGNSIDNFYTSDTNRGLNNYNYFRFDKAYVSSINNYNCALGAEDRYLDRFEFFRHTLNSNRELAAWYITGNADDGKGDGNIMAKWVVDKSVAPYPILKPQGTYPSVVNHDAVHAEDIGDEAENHNKGRKFGELTVNISLGTGAPTGAGIKTGKSSVTLNITDKDTEHYDFNYRKVQLPYYNEVGTGNYTHNKVVTGWKITNFNGGTPGSFTTGVDAPAYNFVDRKCTNKDFYGEGGSYRVFSQGAYYEVPDDVSTISIEPYWADCTYLADASLDVTYNTGYGTESQSTVAHYTNGGSYSINGDNQLVYTSFDNALTALGDTWSGTVYDKAIVLVGNYHKNFGASAPGGNVEKPLTVMSADLNFDNEPDYCLFYAHEQRRDVTPIRFDFITMPSIGLAMKASGSSKYVQAGIFRPKGWFEITNTALIRFSQFEYSYITSKTIASPLILMGGIFEQFVSTNQDGDAGNTTYLHLGGNAWFKEFNNGCHTNQPKKTPKTPISVSGGDFEKFYLSGVYRPNVVPDPENAECYIDGGRFGEVAGAGMQLIDGNVTWLINGADITDFFGGGINSAKSITGNINTTISNSWVTDFYGGPKFGNMAAGKTVTTTATDCHFDNFFGAGYGGNAYNRVGTKDATHDNTNNVSASTWNGYITSDYGRAYNSSQGGISTSFDYEYLIHSNFSSKVARFYVNYASLSLATTRTTTSMLTDCTINKNFYGGGSLGSVNGDVTSTLTDCTVTGSVFGAGFSATTPTIKVMNKENFVVPPSYDYNAGVFNDEHVQFPDEVEYTWTDDASKFTLTGSSASYFYDSGDIHLIYTSTTLSDLGRVTGTVKLNIKGNTLIKGYEFDDDGNQTTTQSGGIYGGGDASGVTGSAEVTVNASSQQTEGYNVYNVYGGGNHGTVSGNTTVTLQGNTVVEADVFGGGNMGIVEGSARVDITE